MKTQRRNRGIAVISAVVGGGLLTPRPGYFTLRIQTPYPLYRRLGEYQDRFVRVRKMSSPSGFDSRSI